MLDADAPAVLKDEDKLSAENAPDVADERRERYRKFVIKSEDGDSDRTLGTGVKPSNLANFSRYGLTLESEDDKRVQVVSYVPKREKLESGTKVQTLAEHVGLVRQRMDELLDRLDLSETIKTAARLAAEWHDHGKNRERWQRTVNGIATVSSTEWLKQEGEGGHQCLGKSGGTMKRDPRGYRHEFGSLREFTDAVNDSKLPDDVFNLAMHLIATHHGRGRPHFPKGAFDPDCEGQSEQVHADAIRRFARLQRKYGWWHLAWLENLLRCADALASADQDAEDDPADSQGDKQ